eukprot:6172992-Pleurochrysis_carterae.AAC.1
MEVRFTRSRLAAFECRSTCIHRISAESARLVELKRRCWLRRDGVRAGWCAYVCAGGRAYKRASVRACEPAWERARENACERALFVCVRACLLKCMRAGRRLGAVHVCGGGGRGLNVSERLRVNFKAVENVELATDPLQSYVKPFQQQIRV